MNNREIMYRDKMDKITSNYNDYDHAYAYAETFKIDIWYNDDHDYFQASGGDIFVGAPTLYDCVDAIYETVEAEFKSASDGYIGYDIKDHVNYTDVKDPYFDYGYMQIDVYSGDIDVDASTSVLSASELYKNEYGDVYTREELYDEWQKQVADGYFESDDPLASNFNLWLREGTGKNGSLEVVSERGLKRKWEYAKDDMLIDSDDPMYDDFDLYLKHILGEKFDMIKSTTKINASDSTYTVSRVSFQIQDGIIVGYFEEDEMDTFDNEAEAIAYAEDYSKDEVYPDTGYVVTENGDLYNGTIIWADYPIGEEYEEPEDVDPDWLDTLIRAMEAAGYYYDDIAGGTPSGDQTDIGFDVTGYNSVYFDSWDEVYDWLNGVVFDDPEISDEVDRILNSYE